MEHVDIDKLANTIALEWRKKTGNLNVLGSVNKEVAKLLPTILEVLAESEIDMTVLKKKASHRKRIQITKLSKGIFKFLADQELYDFKRVDSEGLEENINMMYAHLPKATRDQMISSCLPEVDEFDKIDGIVRIQEPDEIPLFSLFGGSKLAVTLPGKVKQRKRFGDRYIPKPLLPSPPERY